MNNVFYVEKMNTNLISFGKLTDNNTIILKGNIAKIRDKNNELIAVAYKENRTYKIKSILKHKENFVNTANCSNRSMSLKEKWHRMLGHINFGYLNILCKQELLTGIPNELESEFMKCKICIENKMHNLPFSDNRIKAKDILEIAKVYCIKSKEEVFNFLVQFVNESENLTGKRVKILRCDNGKEYLNNRFYKFTKEKPLLTALVECFLNENR